MLKIIILSFSRRINTLETITLTKEKHLGAGTFGTVDKYVTKVYGSFAIKTVRKQGTINALDEFKFLLEICPFNGLKIKSQENNELSLLVEMPNENKDKKPEFKSKFDEFNKVQKDCPVTTVLAYDDSDVFMRIAMKSFELSGEIELLESKDEDYTAKKLYKFIIQIAK